MAIKFNNLNNFNAYNLIIGQEGSKKTEEAKREELKELNQSTFKGLENETDLLTQNAQNLYGVKLGQRQSDEKDIADSTNAIMASLGFKYKVTPAQVASVSNGMQSVILPSLKMVENAAIASRIEDPNGPFADLFSKEV